MMHVNQPLRLRTELGMTPSEAGRNILHISLPKRAYDSWARIEKDNADADHLSNSMGCYIRTLLWLIDHGHDDLVRAILEA